MTTPYTIRLATPDDAEAIATVHVRTWQFAYRGQIADAYLDNMSVQRGAARWRERLMAPDAQERTLVAEVAGEIVGFCVVGRSRDADADATVGELYSIHVDAQSMNQGVGSALLKAGEAFLGEQGFALATLWVLEGNQRARRFYERKGWYPDGARKEDEIANAMLAQVRYAVRYHDVAD